jgi:hypothetical protein
MAFKCWTHSTRESKAHTAGWNSEQFSTAATTSTDNPSLSWSAPTSVTDRCAYRQVATFMIGSLTEGAVLLRQTITSYRHTPRLQYRRNHRNFSTSIISDHLANISVATKWLFWNVNKIKTRFRLLGSYISVLQSLYIPSSRCYVTACHSICWLWKLKILVLHLH